MGRTNSTYRNHLDNFISRFKPFKQALRSENQAYLDKLWEKAHSHSHAGAYLNSGNPTLPAIISMLLGLQKETQVNNEELEKLERRIDKLEDGL